AARELLGGPPRAGAWTVAVGRVALFVALDGRLRREVLEDVVGVCLELLGGASLQPLRLRRGQPLGACDLGAHRPSVGLVGTLAEILELLGDLLFVSRRRCLLLLE